MISPLPTLTPSDEVAIVLQFAGVGALVGTALASVLRRRDRDADTWFVTASVTLLLAALGVVFVAGHRLGWW